MTEASPLSLLARTGRSFTKHWFVFGLLGAVLLGRLFPGGGRSIGPLSTKHVLHAGVALIFFAQGLTLSLGDLKRGARNVRLHLLIQIFTFGVIPLLGIGLSWLVEPFVDPALALGLLYLAVLPSTVKTAVVFSSLAGGDSAAAVFNATLSSVLGAFLTPFWVGLFTRRAGSSSTGGFSDVVIEVAALLLVPLAIGALLRPAVARHVDPRKNELNRLASFVVLFIVYAAFARSFEDGTWAKQGPSVTLVAFVVALVFFALATGLTHLASRCLALPRPDAITALFSAPQKTLATGAPLAELLFRGRSDLGLILLPLLFYHPLQLFLGSLLVARLARGYPNDGALARAADGDSVAVAVSGARPSKGSTRESG